MITNACEMWVLTESMERKLLKTERKIIRRIFGRTKDRDGTRRIETSDELNYLIRIENVIN